MTTLLFIYCSSQRPAVVPREDHLLPTQGPRLLKERGAGKLHIRPTVLAADKFGGRAVVNESGPVHCSACDYPVHLLKMEL